MKRTAIFVASLFLLFSAKAQGVHFGVKGGINVSQLHFEDNSTSDSKVGVHLGVLAHIHTSSRQWAIQPELLYSLEGAKKVGSAGDTYNLNYLNVPVLVQYLFDNGFRIEGGPQVGFLLKANIKGGGITVEDKGYKSTAFSIPLGIGYLSSAGWGIDARYVFGLSDINDIRNGGTIQSNVFQLGLFYQMSDTKMSRHRR
ncbi:MAG: PorT family protein [Bacteroidota bacterium]|nr:PorT family protein [Bacteroidota bacterium]